MPEQRTKLAVLAAVEEGETIADACRRFGIHRATYYRWRARFDRGGVEALDDKPRVAATCPHRTSPEIVTMILSLSAGHPGWGCKKLAAYLALDGYETSSPTIQKILMKSGLGRHADRRRFLVEAAANGTHLSREQLAFLANAS